MNQLYQDLRQGLRTITKNKGFTLVAVLTLALGIGANSAIFSVVSALLLRPLPFKTPEQLVQIWETNVKRPENKYTVSYPNFVDWRNQNQVFEQVAAYSDITFNLTGTSEPERLQGAIISPSFFTILGVKPVLGRVLTPEEDYPQKAFSVVMGEGLWRRRFNSDPKIIGQTISLNNESFTVVGVIPSLRDVADLAENTELWVSISHSDGFDNRYGHYLDVIARLKPGVTPKQAQASMDSIAASLAAQFPDSNTDHGVRVVPLQEQIVGDFKLALIVLLGAVIFVLLIAAANVANMMLVRTSARQKEIAIRIALGAGRWRLARQLLTESLLLSILGGVVGLLLAQWGIYLLVAFGPADMPRTHEVTLDGRVLGFTFVVSLLTGVVFGLVPALQASRPEVNDIIKEGGRSATGSKVQKRVRGLLVASEIALSFVLLIGAALLMRSFLNLRAVNPGFNPRNLLTMRIRPTGPNYQKDSQLIAFYDQLLTQIKAMPGVQSVATRSHVPVARDDGFARLSFAIEGRLIDPANRLVAFYNAVSPDYFHTMEIPVLKGRSFDEHDDRDAKSVIIINETLAHQNFGEENPIGKRMTLNDENPKEADWATIVGIVKDTKPIELAQEPVAEMYMPFAQQPERGVALMIRTINRPEDIAAAVRHALQTIDKDQPIYSIRTLNNVMSESVATPRFRTSLLGVFAAVALILALIGIYGVMSYSVSQRTQEIGIRMALGAQGHNVLTMIVRQGLAMILTGLGIGLAIAFALTRVIEGLLFGLVPKDPITFMATALVLAATALLACYIPARKATKIDPLTALRYE